MTPVDIYEECNCIRGFFGIREATILIETAIEYLLSNHEPPTFVELGVWCGRSAMMLGLASKGREGSKVYAIDAWTEETRHPVLPITNEEAEKDFLRVREDLGLGDIVIQLKGRTVDVAKGWDGGQTVSLLHVDAGHTYEDCFADLEAWEPFIASKGRIVLHDYNNLRECGVRRAAETYFSNKPYVLTEAIPGMMASWRKNDQ